jgi:hypothetical protein
MIQTILLFTLRRGVTDGDAYRRWFGHPEHARVRAELLAPLIERRERCQIRI